MRTKAFAVLMGGAVILGAGAASAAAQVSGRVVLNQGPIAVDVVFGSAPVRYQRGMSLRELDLYLARIEYEYDFFRRMHPKEAEYRFGWSREQLRAYVRFLRDERRFLRDERERYDHRFEAPGRGAGRGRGLAWGAR